jgi:hypothetical protein
MFKISYASNAIVIIIRRTALSIPLDVLVDKEKNVYEMTCVAISLANIMAADGDEEFENNNEKVVSKVLEQVLLEDVEYTSDDKE